MKKKFSMSIVIAAVLAIALTFAACGGKKETQVVIAFDVQQLFSDYAGTDYGYSQAALVVKKELLETRPATMREFTAKLSTAGEWAENNVSAALAAIAANMTEGVETTVSGLSKEVVERCNINFVKSADIKADADEFMQMLVDMNAEMDNGLISAKPDDGFYASISADAADTATGKLKVFMPDGAPALALAELMSKGSVSAAEYEVVIASTIASKLTSGAADIAVVPTNAAAKLYNGNQKYVMLGVVTHGNLFIVGEQADNLERLKGKTVAVIGQGNIPDIVFRYILKKANIPYAVGDTAAANRITLRFFADSGAVVKALKAGQADYGLLAEPAVGAALTAL